MPRAPSFGSAKDWESPKACRNSPFAPAEVCAAAIGDIVLVHMSTASSEQWRPTFMLVGSESLTHHETCMTQASFHGTRLRPRGIVLFATQPCGLATAGMIEDLDKEQDFTVVSFAFSLVENCLAKTKSTTFSHDEGGFVEPYKQNGCT